MSVHTNVPRIGPVVKPQNERSHINLRIGIFPAEFPTCRHFFGRWKRRAGVSASLTLRLGGDASLTAYSRHLLAHPPQPPRRLRIARRRGRRDRPLFCKVPPAHPLHLRR